MASVENQIAAPQIRGRSRKGRRVLFLMSGITLLVMLVWPAKHHVDAVGLRNFELKATFIETCQRLSAQGSTEHLVTHSGSGKYFALPEDTASADGSAIASNDAGRSNPLAAWVTPLLSGKIRSERYDVESATLLGDVRLSMQQDSTIQLGTLDVLTRSMKPTGIVQEYRQSIRLSAGGKQSHVALTIRIAIAIRAPWWSGRLVLNQLQNEANQRAEAFERALREYVDGNNPPGRH